MQALLTVLPPYFLIMSTSEEIAERTEVGKRVRWLAKEGWNVESGIVVHTHALSDGTLIVEINAITGQLAGKRIGLPYSCLLGPFWDEFEGTQIYF